MSYGAWQEPVLASLNGSRDRAERVSYGEWQELVLAVSKWQEPIPVQDCKGTPFEYIL